VVAVEPADLSLPGQLASLWARHLGVKVEPGDNFFELGGNSLVAARVMREVRDLTGCSLPLSTLLQAPTPAQLAAVVQAAETAPSPVLVRMREGRGDPLYLVHGLSGTVMECWSMVAALRTSRPVCGLQAPGLDDEAVAERAVEQMATTYVAHIRTVQHHGPYAICGHSFGGLVAYEMARQLAAAGEAVEPLVLLDPYMHGRLDIPTRIVQAAWRMGHMRPAQAWSFFVTRMARIRLVGPSVPARASHELSPAQARVWDALTDARNRYQPGPYARPVLFVHAQETLPGNPDPMPPWRKLLGDHMRVIELPGEHSDIVGRHAQRVAGILDEGLGAARA
jgi:acetoacetyl-CoA synthetase